MYGTVSEEFVRAIEQIVGAEHVRRDDALRSEYGADALGRGHPADLVIFPASTADVAAVARLCNAQLIPLTPRGAGTGYTGGAVPSRGGVVLALDRLDRIKEIDEANLLAVVEPNVVTGTLQAAVERLGLFYPPDPASLARSAIGGNVAECAGGPRAFKYGTTRRYVLGLEAVLPTGEIIRTGRQVSEERRRLRPDAIAGRFGGDAWPSSPRSRCGSCRGLQPAGRYGPGSLT